MGKLRATCGSIQTKHKSAGQQHLDSYLDPAACLYEVPNPCNNAVRDLHVPVSQQSCRLLRLVTWAWLFSFLNQAVQAEVRARPGRWCRAGSQHHLGGTVATLHTAGSKKSQSKLRCEMNSSWLGVQNFASEGCARKVWVLQLQGEAKSSLKHNVSVYHKS